MRVLSVLLVLIGVPFILLGLLFLVGAGGQTSRYIVAVIGLVLGSVLSGVGVRIFKKQGQLQPEVLRAEILETARKEDGELSLTDIKAVLGTRFAPAEKVLQALQEEGVCRRTTKKGKEYYVFPTLLPRLAMRRCEFCDAELPLHDESNVCPQCGGSVKTGKKELAVSDGEFYGLDE